MSRRPHTVYDCIAECMRPAPTEEQVDLLLIEIAPKLAALGSANALRVCGDLLAIVLNGDEVQVGSAAFGKYLEILCNFIAARARQLEKADANLPGRLQESAIAMSTFDVSVHVKLIDALTAPAKQVQRSMQQLAQTMNGVTSSAAKAGAGMAASFQNAFARIGANFKNFGTELRGHWSRLQGDIMGAAMLSFGVEHSFEKQMHFEELMMNMRAFRLDKEGKLTEQLREKIVRLSAVYPLIGGRSDLAEGAQDLMKMGQSLEDTIAMLDPLARVAAAAHIDAKKAADGLIHVAYASGMPMLTTEEKAKTAEYVGNAVFAAMKGFGGNYDDLVSALTRGGPSSRVAGIPSGVALANVASMMRAGFAPESAGIALNALNLRLNTLGMSKPTKETFKKLKGYGIDMDALRHSPEEFQKWGGDNFAEAMSQAMGANFKDLAPKFQEMMNDKLLQGSADLMRTKMIDAIMGSGQVDPKNAEQMGQLYRSMDQQFMQHFGFDILQFYKKMAESGAYHDSKLMKDLAGIYHLPKFADVDFQFLTGEFEKKLNDYYDHISGATQTHLTMWGEGVVGAWKRTIAMVGVFQERFWHNSGLLEVVHGVLDDVLQFSDKILNAGPKTLTSLRYIGEGLLALAVATPVGLGLWAVGSAISVLLNPVTLLVGGLAYLGYEFYTNAAAIQNWWANLSPLGTALVSGGGIVAGLYAICVAARAVTAAFMASPLGWAVRLAALGLMIYENWSSVAGVFEQVKKAINDLIPSLHPLEKFLQDNWLQRQAKKLNDLMGIDENARPDWLETPAWQKHWWQKLGSSSSATIPEKSGGSEQGAASPKNEIKTVNNSVSAPISVTVNVANSTQAPAAVGQAVGSAIGGRMRGAIHDMPQ